MFFFLINPGFAEDTDADGLDDSWEIHYFTNLTQTATKDPDNDTLINLVEFNLNSSPISIDTDSDNYTDDFEYAYGTNLTDPNDFPRKGLLNISLIYPAFNVSPVSVFNLTIYTINKSSCKYSASRSAKYEEIDNPSQIFSTKDSHTHTIEGFSLNTKDNFKTTIYVYCKSGDYVNNDFPEPITLSIDRTPPKILSFTAEPNPVIEKLEVELIAKTDDEAYCKFKPFNITIEEIAGMFNDPSEFVFNKTNKLKLDKNTNPKIEDLKSYTFFAACMNRAGWYDLSLAGFQVNLSTPNKIINVSPTGYINGEKTEIRVITNKDSECRFGDNYLNIFPQQNSKLHFIQKQNLSSGKYDIPVMCIFNDAGIIETIVSFIVDNQNPSLPVITSESEICSNTSISADFYSQDDNGILYYNVRLFDSSSNLVYKTKSNASSLNASLNLTRQETYYWEVYAVDKAKNKGQIKKSLGTKVLMENDEKCKINNPPYLDIAAEFSEKGLSLALSCKDKEGYCKKKHYALSSNPECNGASFSPITYSTKLNILNNSFVCFNLTDNNNKENYGVTEIRFRDCGFSQNKDNSTCCLGKQAYICNENCTLVKEVSCNPDALDTDNDGIPDSKEKECGLDPYLNDALDDFDNDTLSNKIECLTYNTSVNNKDTDNDSYDDNIEIDNNTDPLDSNDFPKQANKDSDNDGIPDSKEKECGLDPNDPSDARKDNDRDGISNRNECVRYSTNLNKRDSDNDGYPDLVEIEKNTDPLNSSEHPRSHIFNIVLFVFGIISLISGLVIISKTSPKNNLRSLNNKNIGINKNKVLNKKSPVLSNSLNKPGVKSQSPKNPLAFNKSPKKFSFSLFSRPKNQTSAKPPIQNNKKPLISFKMPKKSSKKTSISSIPKNNYSADISRKKPVFFQETDLDREIRKKRKLLKLKEKTSVFDEFSEFPMPEQKKSDDALTKEEISVFERLDDLSKKDAFEDIELMKKKEAKK